MFLLKCVALGGYQTLSNCFTFFFVVFMSFLCAWFWVLRAWTKSAKAKQDEIKENKKCIHPANQPAAIQWASKLAIFHSYIRARSIQLVIGMYMNVAAHWHLACLTLFRSIALPSVYIYVLFLILYLMLSLSRALYSYCCLNKQVHFVCLKNSTILMS